MDDAIHQSYTMVLILIMISWVVKGMHWSLKHFPTNAPIIWAVNVAHGGTSEKSHLALAVFRCFSSLRTSWDIPRHLRMSQDALGQLKHLKTARARWPFPDAVWYLWRENKGFKNGLNRVVHIKKFWDLATAIMVVNSDSLFLTCYLPVLHSWLMFSS